MKKKILKVNPEAKCIGCELCIFASLRLCGKAGLSDSPIKIFSSGEGFNIHLEESVNELDVKKISEVCPKSCFLVEEVDSQAENTVEFI